MFEKFLEELGLSEKESRVYLALLQYESAGIHEIATKTKINRTTVYPVLESLGKKGLVSEVQDGKKTAYHAEPPERLETYVERQKVVLQEQSERLKDIIPQIKSIQREQGERPIIKYFEGRDGAISAYEEFYKFDPNADEVGYFIFDKDLIKKTFTEEEQDRFISKRIGKEVRPISVYNYSGGTYKFKSPGTRAHIDQKKYPLRCDISVIQDRVVITTLGEKIGAYLIKSKDIADTLKSLVRKINEI